MAKDLTITKDGIVEEKKVLLVQKETSPIQETTVVQKKKEPTLVEDIQTPLPKEIEPAKTPKLKDIDIKQEIKGETKKKVKKEKKPSKIKIWWNKLKPFQRTTSIIFLLILIFGSIFLYFLLIIFKPTIPPYELISIDSRFIQASAYDGNIKNNLKIVLNQLPYPEVPKTEESPLNGELFTYAQMQDLLQRRPIAVMTNNHVAARPLSGLSSADIVYESLVESGITRHMAIYWSKSPNKVGPIRSARQYYLEWLSPYDPIYIHDGCALSEDPRVNACGNIYTYNIKDLATSGAWRVNDGTRVAPHNEYVSPIQLWETAEKYSWDEFPEIESWKFKRDADIENRGERTKIKLTFRTDLANGGLYDASWTYDTTTNSYFRKIGGQADMDLETGTQITAKTVIIQEVKMQSAFDEKSRIIITTIDSGNATFLIDGNIVVGTWEKDSRTDRTTFFADDKELEFNRGKIWISIAPQGYAQFDIIEQ